MSDKQFTFSFRPALCIHCHACQTACTLWHETPPDFPRRRVLSGFQGAYPSTKLLALSVACLHCAEPACVAVCPVGALVKEPHGPVTLNKDICVGCGACGRVCPVHAPQFDGSGTMDKCDLCAYRPGDAPPPCVAVCPSRALTLAELTPEQQAQEEKDTIALYGLLSRQT